VQNLIKGERNSEGFQVIETDKRKKPKEDEDSEDKK
jgi:hypothetical protein